MIVSWKARPQGTHSISSCFLPYGFQFSSKKLHHDYWICPILSVLTNSLFTAINGVSQSALFLFKQIDPKVILSLFSMSLDSRCPLVFTVDTYNCNLLAAELKWSSGGDLEPEENYVRIWLKENYFTSLLFISEVIIWGYYEPPKIPLRTGWAKGVKFA